ncbi:MAG TPA: hypothetical protein PKX11_04690 [Methanospirillum sp.]|nr:hypothetical protein [Methanospirillum sp.]
MLKNFGKAEFKDIAYF